MGLLSRAFLFLIIGYSFWGCEDKKEANLYKAQNCLNKAVPSTATSCLSFISSQTSERSYVLRCSIAFLAEGIDETAIVDALTNIDGANGGDPTSATIAALAMSTTDAASTALSYCTLSGSKSLAALAGFANISTIMGSLLPGLTYPFTAAQVEAAIASYNGAVPADSDAKAALGSALIASQSSLCNATNGLFKNDPACTDINQAIAANPDNPNAIADALLANLQNQSN
jgi:hypothetical protein